MRVYYLVLVLYDGLSSEQVPPENLINTYDYNDTLGLLVQVSVHFLLGMDVSSALSSTFVDCRIVRHYHSSGYRLAGL